MNLSDITVGQFRKYLQTGDTQGLSGWEDLFLMFIDKSGIGQTQEYELMMAIHNLNVRMVSVNAFIDLQKVWFLNFEEAFEPAFKDLAKFGIKITYDPAEPRKFIQRLELIESSEKRNVAEIDSLTKELQDLRSKGVKNSGKFVDLLLRLIVTLNKEGYRIEKDVTDMEEFALMIKQHNEAMNLLRERK
jgi:hypothetical protein